MKEGPRGKKSETGTVLLLLLYVPVVSIEVSTATTKKPYGKDEKGVTQ